ncbi:hypothetical protein U14_03341 [Candidatus Moduliflexus flocculans]|uniref:Uncharacterized protein n=1 Tax=Candidatus Moduliflexus flocculans TaxID=1499966 RepID=A0A081BNX7_9BACT|nr:hypothetical protein U14_03341 [Candidatus Moduliflexus flocculans]
MRQLCKPTDNLVHPFFPGKIEMHQLADMVQDVQFDILAVHDTC